MDFMIFLLTALLYYEVRALKLLNVTVPALVKKGDSVDLKCSYDLETDRLSRISWYKDNTEFIKYFDNKDPKYYEVNGITTELRKSSKNNIRLTSVNLQTSGMFKCEVVGEAPLFQSVSGEAYMEVVVLPEDNPKITSEEKIYASGDILALNCTSGRTFPATRLKWFINDIEVKEDSQTKTHRHGDTIVTISSLRLELGPDHLSHGSIKIKCEAKVETKISIKEPALLRQTVVFVRGLASDLAPSLLALTLAFLVQRILALN